MQRVGILFGGRSGEHDVSLCSAASVVEALDRNRFEPVAIGIDRDGRWYPQESPVIVEDKDFGRIMQMKRQGTWYVNHYCDGNQLHMYNAENGEKISVDVVVPVVHGTYCEDGTLQGLLELSMVPYAGADVAGSAIGMDKDVAKRLMAAGDIPVVPWEVVHQTEWDSSKERVLEKAGQWGLPIFVKPACTGSSVGVKKVSGKEGLAQAIDYAFRFDTKVLIEKGIAAREIECAVLGNQFPEASCLGEVIPNHEFYSYESKYIDPDGAKLVIPADIDSGLSDRIRATAVRAFTVLNCSGMARVDFFLDKQGKDFYLNEINTLPGFTSISMYPKLWDYSGLRYTDLITKLIDLAVERHRLKMTIETGTSYE